MAVAMCLVVSVLFAGYLWFAGSLCLVDSLWFACCLCLADSTWFACCRRLPNGLRIGIDLGNVCMTGGDHYGQADGTSALNVPDCIESLRTLRDAGHHLYIISWCGARRATATMPIVASLGLFDGVYFVRDRRYKDMVCQRLGIDVMIDDRMDVLQSITLSQTMQFRGCIPSSDPRCMGTFEPTYSADDWINARYILSAVLPTGLVPNIRISLSAYCHLWHTVN